MVHDRKFNAFWHYHFEIFILYRKPISTGHIEDYVNDRMSKNLKFSQVTILSDICRNTSKCEIRAM
jgi:hypothetical protein